MTTATLSAILLGLAALMQSISYLCRKLPEGRRPEWYPKDSTSQAMLDISWMLCFALGAGAAFQVSFWLGILAVVLYFAVLPFLFQSALARLLGFRNLRELVDTIDSQ